MCANRSRRTGWTEDAGASGALLGMAGPAPATERVQLDDGAFVLRRAALGVAPVILTELAAISTRAPFRNMITPGGFRMSVAMTNCGDCGWVTDRTGYRYAAADPLSGNRWPPIPDVLLDLAARTARDAGFDGFEPDACLVNRYEPGTRLSLHQDKDEADKSWPVVSVSLGLPATFIWGGPRRTDRTRRVPLVHGDVVVWGGPSRLNFHGVLAVKAGAHPLTGATRINLTLRRAR